MEEVWIIGSDLLVQRDEGFSDGFQGSDFKKVGTAADRPRVVFQIGQT